ncbi:MAG: TetR/AcrR family transcriptional regulator [Rhodoferax sp.]|nr:TetR/AcrR family transcriptional regulator [Rhodoferax sp.]
MARKAPRRTAERILEVTLDLFNRFGEPNVSTTLIAAELRISPGNLYYHYPAKDELINALYARFERDMGRLLEAAGEVRDVEDAWFFLHSVFERIWEFRFLYRDLNDLLSKNRLLETQVRGLLQAQSAALERLLRGMVRCGSLRIEPDEAPRMATNMLVVLTYWLSYAYVLDPRHALEQEAAQDTMLHGARQVLELLTPHLEAAQRAHLRGLSAAYRSGPADSVAPGQHQRQH